MALIRGKVYAVGGVDATSNDCATVERYDPGTDSWESVANMPTPRSYLAAVAYGRHLYALGGDLDEETLADVERYDPARDAWERLAPVPTPRKFFAAVELGGFLYAIGGETQGEEYTATVDRYEFASGEWSPSRLRPPFQETW